MLQFPTLHIHLQMTFELLVPPLKSSLSVSFFP